MLRKDREIILENLTAEIKENNVIYLVDFQGLNVEQITQFRRKLRSDDAILRVAKNTLIKLARENLKREPIASNLLIGSSALIFCKDDPISTAKIIKEFLREHPKPQVKAIFINDDCIDGEKYEEYAELPGVVELRAKVVGALNGPIYGLVSVISGLLRGFVNQLDQLAKREENN